MKKEKIPLCINIRYTCHDLLVHPCAVMCEYVHASAYVYTRAHKHGYACVFMYLQSLSLFTMKQKE